MGNEEDFSLDEFFLMYECKLEDMLFFSNGFRTEIKNLLADLNKYTKCNFSCILYHSNRFFDFYCENEKNYFSKFRDLVNQHIDCLDQVNPHIKTKLGIIHLFTMNENLRLVTISHSLLTDPKTIGYISETIDSIILLIDKTTNRYYQQCYNDNSSSPANNSSAPAELTLFIKKPK